MSQHDHEELTPTPGERFRTILKNHPEARQATIYGLLFTVFFVLIGLYLYPKFMPNVMSDNMEKGKNVIVWFTVLSAPIAGVVLGITAVALRNRHRGNTPPEDGPAIHGHGPIVGTWTVVSAIFCTLAIVWGLVEMNVSSDNAKENAPSALVVEVTGSQWLWTYNYPEFGIETHELNLPIERPVIFKVRSADVNHSFWPVQLGVKVDANAGVTTQTRTTPERLGHLDIRCAELCGLYHAYMGNSGNVLSLTDFNNWVTAEGGQVSA